MQPGTFYVQFKCWLYYSTEETKNPQHIPKENGELGGPGEEYYCPTLSKLVILVVSFAARGRIS
jgi:hypothetical protein